MLEVVDMNRPGSATQLDRDKETEKLRPAYLTELSSPALGGDHLEEIGNSKR
jgi:hypothetical protein